MVKFVEVSVTLLPDDVFSGYLFCYACSTDWKTTIEMERIKLR